jgi:hypothetical protein
MQVNISTTEEATIDSQLTSRLQQLQAYMAPMWPVIEKVDAKQIKTWVERNDVVSLPMCWRLYKWLRPHFKRFDAIIDGEADA